MGIGLWLAHESVLAMRGSIDVMNPTAGPGTVFRVTLPKNGVGN